MKRLIKKSRFFNFELNMRRRITYQKYNPALSVAENAVILGCSIASVRKYIKQQMIDRGYDASYIKWKRINEFAKQNPSATYRQKSETLGYSVNTIKKYERITSKELDVSKRDTNKVSNFDICNKNCIKSVSSNQDEILEGIIKLYNNNQPFEADLTASKCIFYSKNIPKPKYLFDKYPQIEDVLPLDRADNLEASSFNSIIYDLPFIISSAKDSCIKERFTTFSSIKELYSVNDEMLNRAIRLLKSNGVLIIKTMDVSFQGKQIWISDYIIQRASQIGLELMDKFILTSSWRMLSKTITQHRARKYHAYFFVFKKH